MTKPSLTFWNIRRGFATNSSSSHSMVLLDKPASEVLSPVEAFDDYGWDNFTLLDGDSKKNYLANLIGASLVREVGKVIALQVLKDLNLLDPQTDEWVERDIDHQSQVSFPQNDDQSALNMQFLQELTAWALRDDVAILGGNDNSDGHPDEEKGVMVPWSSWLSNHLVAWKDTSTNTWSLFSKKNGLSLRFSFDDMGSLVYNDPYASPVEPDSNAPAQRPNLVDIKITDRCPFACAYCYQGSTPKAPHAPLSKLVAIADALAEQQVFEVALGGGEPTLHPDFALIINAFYERGVTPNITTRNTTWLQSPAAQELLAKMGAVAVSIDNLKNTQVALDALDKMHHHNQNLRTTRNMHTISSSVQIVLGTQSKEEFQAMVRLVLDQPRHGPKLTFLGYKDHGLGAQYRADPEKEQRVAEARAHWLDWVLEVYTKMNAEKREQDKAQGKSFYAPGLWLNVDTAVAQHSGERLKELEGGDRMYHHVEGTQSMYIDAVRNVMAPSSFARPEDDRPWDETTWVETFQGFSSLQAPTVVRRRRR